MSGAKQITNEDLLYSTGNYAHIFCESYKGKEYEKDYIYVCMHACSVMSDSATQWTVACQAPLSRGFFRQEYWNGLPFPSPGDHPDPGIEPMSPAAPVLAGGFFTTQPPGKPHIKICMYIYLNHFAVYLKLIQHCKYYTSIKKKEVNGVAQGPDWGGDPTESWPVPSPGLNYAWQPQAEA